MYVFMVANTKADSPQPEGRTPTPAGDKDLPPKMTAAGRSVSLQAPRKQSLDGKGMTIASSAASIAAANAADAAVTGAAIFACFYCWFVVFRAHHLYALYGGGHSISPRYFRGWMYVLNKRVSQFCAVF